MVDADKFKQINTRFGHLTGDLVLAEIPGVLKASICGSDAVVRYGGDEFLILLADTTEVGAGIVVQRINTRLADWNGCNHLKDFQVNLSIGVSGWEEGETLDEVLDAADRRCTNRKTSSKIGFTNSARCQVSFLALGSQRDENLRAPNKLALEEGLVERVWAR
jgi:diguanylate cyclase (GGDEF)-like protein